MHDDEGSDWTVCAIVSNQLLKFIDVLFNSLNCFASVAY
jgi:hypothetical protein